MLNEMIGKAIFNASPRSLEDLKLVYAANAYRELLFQYIMGENGILQNLNRGTMMIVQPECMTLYVQEKLAEFINTGRIVYKDGHSFHSNVRFIFCTSADLKRLVKEGEFHEKLYYLISENEMKDTENIYSDFSLFSRYIQNGLHYYYHLYEKKWQPLDEKQIKELWRNYRKASISDMEFAMEEIARNGYGKIRSGEEKEKSQICSLEEIEMEQLRKMLADGYNKKEIAEILKLSRTTLYRKLKRYQLE